MNFVFNKKTITFVLSSIAISIPIVLTSCSSSSWQDKTSKDNLFSLPTYGNETPDYSKTPNPVKKNNQQKKDPIQFISERTFSLKMISHPDVDGRRSVGYGTGWLFAKDQSLSTNNLTYYLATNLHVGSILFNSGKKAYEYDPTTRQYSLKTNQVFDEIQFGQVVSPLNGQTSIFKNNYKVGTRSDKLDYSKTYYTQMVDKSGIEFSYLTFDMFNKMKIQDKFKVYNEDIISNATQDLAILKIDFSKRKDIRPNSILTGTDPILKALKAYDDDPTVFATSEYTNSSNDFNITVGGFPFTKGIMPNSGDGAWTTSKSINNLSYDEKMFGTNFNRQNWNHNLPLHEQDMEKIKKEYILDSNIPFITNDYASYMNTSLQVLFANLNLAGGSSGSMAINQDNEVIGIYWGIYTKNTYMNGLVNYGVVDLFINESNNNDVQKYNTISDFATKVKNTNLHYN